MYAQTAANILVYSRFAAVLFFEKINCNFRDFWQYERKLWFMNINQYLEEEKISKLILKFSISCITSMPVSSLYNIVDQIFVGRGNDFIPYG